MVGNLPPSAFQFLETTSVTTNDEGLFTPAIQVSASRRNRLAAEKLNVVGLAGGWRGVFS
jgi:hypothetical protein